MSARFVVGSVSLGTFLWAAIFCIGVFSCTNAFGQTYLTITGFSYHVDREGRGRAVAGRCEFNPGLGVRSAITEKLDGIVGIYSNSSCETSVYAGASRKLFDVGRAQIGAFLMLVTGYEPEVALAAGPTVRLEHAGTGYTFGYIPAGAGVFWLQFDRKW